MSAAVPATPGRLPAAAPPASRPQLWLALAGVLFVVDSVCLSALPYLGPDSALAAWADDGGMLATLCALCGVVLLLVQIARLAWRSRRQTVGLRELVVLAVLASIAQASGAGVDGALALQTAGAIAFFMLVSLLVESQSAVGARQSLEQLVRLAPGKARRLRADGQEDAIEPEALQPGDTLRVQPGETVYADGRIVKGAAALQEANITGESLPVDKQAGDPVFAGTLNLNGLIEVAVERAGRNTTLGKVRELILEAERTRLPFVRLVDHYVRYYAPVVLMLAALVWFATGHDLARVTAFLVAACPIALILATPSATIAALSAAARVGILIKNVSDLEGMARIDAFVFDKTGTITRGELGVRRVAPVPGVTPAELVGLAAGAEQRSNHPVAAAIRQLAATARVPLVEPERLHEEPGRGVRATVGGRAVNVGNLRWMADHGLSARDFPAPDADSEGVSLLYVMADGRAHGWLALEDQVRDDAQPMLEALRQQGVQHIALVTGDRGSVAARVAARLAISQWRGDCVPAEKVQYVNEIKQRGRRVAFVGDGINDGPALAASHIGVAMGAAGSDVAMDSATIALLNNRLNRLPFLLRLARQTRLAILQNFLAGGIVVFGGMALSAAGRLPPLAAAILQVAGSLVVVLNSARLVRAGESLE